MAGKKRWGGLVKVELEDAVEDGNTVAGVKTLVQSNFPELEVVKRGAARDTYVFTKKEGGGCSLSVKIPSDVNTAGEAIHVNAIFNADGKEYPVYPTDKYGEKLGAGHFKSKTIPRNGMWRKNLMVEAVTGMDICRKAYGSEMYMSDREKRAVYDLLTERKDLMLKSREASKKLIENTSEFGKERRSVEIAEITAKIKEINEKIQRM